MNATEQLRTVNVHILGAVLNAVASSGDRYYYYNKYRYGNYHAAEKKGKRVNKA